MIYKKIIRNKNIIEYHTTLFDKKNKSIFIDFIYFSNTEFISFFNKKPLNSYFYKNFYSANKALLKAIK